MPALQAHLPLDERGKHLQQLLQLHDRPGVKAEQARLLRQRILLALSEAPDALPPAEARYFVAEHLMPADFGEIRWQSPEQALAVAALLDTLRPLSGAPASPGSNRYELARHALHYFNRERAFGAMRRFVEGLSFPLASLDDEMCDLVARAWQAAPPPETRGRVLSALLATLMFFLLLGFPLLFMAVEAAPSGLAAGDAPLFLTESHPTPSYLDGLYWSLMSFPSLEPDGTGPRTPAGQTLSRIAEGAKFVTLGVMGAWAREAILLRQLLPDGPARNRARRDQEFVTPREMLFVVNGTPVRLRGRDSEEIAEQLALLARWLTQNPHQGARASPDDEPPEEIS